MGHNYWEMFTDSSGEENLAQLNLTQLRRYNEEYLAALKSRLISSAGKNSTYGTSLDSDIVVMHNALNANKKTFRVHNYSLINALAVKETKSDVSFVWAENSDQAIPKDTPDNLYFVLKQKRFAPVVQKANSIKTDATKRYLNLNNAELLVLKDEHDSALR